MTSVVTLHCHILTSDEIAMIPTNSLRWFRQEKIWKLYAFCLLPNYNHILVKFLDGRPIEHVIGQFHSFTGPQILENIKRADKIGLLEILHTAGMRKRYREFLLWEGCMAKCVEKPGVFLRSIEYIHNNPSNKNWNLTADRADYGYSSACYYDRGGKPVIEIDDYEELLGETPSH